ncbi:MAG: hypothetical protein JSS83_13375 [Cyanobacteria bacterium SZAS LIN-3]|nr:hypothetical protein [Cyanobacteria bacterium SZAS LIN-3]
MLSLRFKSIVALLVGSIALSFMVDARGDEPRKSTSSGNPVATFKLPGNTIYGWVGHVNWAEHGGMQEVSLSGSRVARANLTVPIGDGLMFQASGALSMQPDLMDQFPVAGVRGFVFDGTELNDAGIAHCARFTEVERLGLDATEVGDGAIAVAARLPRMKFLSVGHSNCRAANIALLNNLKHLEFLDLNSNLLTPGVLKNLHSDSLRVLDLRRCRLENSDIAYLTNVPNLVRIRIGENKKLNDDCIVHLNRLKKLQSIDVCLTSITADGLCKLTPPGFNMLKVNPGQYSKAELAKIRKHFPGLSLWGANDGPSADPSLFRPLH